VLTICPVKNFLVMILRYVIRYDRLILPFHHRQRGSASTTATGQVNERWRILIPYRVETPELTATKFGS